ncbi:MAG: T9SS type A sorting domain-containing protein [Calditrichota bacterium]
MKNIVILFLVFTLVVGAQAAPKQSIMSASPQTPADRIIFPWEDAPAAPYVLPDPNRPHHPPRDLIIGERFQAGDTWYDYQSNGTVGKMIITDDQGDVHITWMDGNGSDLNAATRNQKYTYFHDDDFDFDDGVQINDAARGGYGSIWLSNENPQRALSFHHSGLDTAVRSNIAIDWGLGVGAFNSFLLPRYPDRTIIWPQGVMSRQGRIHVVYNRRDAGMISYVQGALNRQGDPVFGDVVTQVGETHLNSYRIAVSPTSERAAVTWLRPRSGIPPDQGWDGFLAYQIHNDLMLAWTDDGVNWNFDEPLNVTNNIPPDGRREGNAKYGDTLFVFNNHDLIFDAEDNIHIVFDTRLLKVQPIPESEPPIDALTIDAGYIFHWSEETNEITPVADGWFTHREADEQGNTVRWPTPGAWKTNVCNPSLGYDENADLYCVFNYYPLNDYSEADYCNGDISVTVSEDNGRTWYHSTRITVTRSHLAEAGESECEDYPTLAEQVDDFLHISYELDTEPGSVIQNRADRVEVASLCQWFYHRLPRDEVLRDSIFQGPPFHVANLPLVENARRNPGAPRPNELVTVSTHVLPSGGNQIEVVTLEYRLNEGDAERVDMNALEDNMYEAAIPEQEEGASIWYHIVALDNEGNQTIVPEGWWYSYMVRSDGELTIHDVQFRPAEWTVDYSPYMDYEVTVTGVTTTSPDFAAVYGAYAVQDAAEEWSGIWVKGIAEDIALGTRITVTGIVRERDEADPSKWRYQTYIEMREWEAEGQAAVPEPIQVQLGDLNYSERAENLEGVLVEVGRFEIDSLNRAIAYDTSYFPITVPGTDEKAWMTKYGLSFSTQRDLGMATWGRWTVITRLRGIFAENQHYAIAPREAADFGEVAAPLIDVSVPNDFSLDPVFPNPFNHRAIIGFELEGERYLTLGLYDPQGRLVLPVTEGTFTAGRHYYTLNASDLSSGIYILKLDDGKQSLSQKVVLLR